MTIYVFFYSLRSKIQSWFSLRSSSLILVEDPVLSNKHAVPLTGSLFGYKFDPDGYFHRFCLHYFDEHNFSSSYLDPSCFNIPLPPDRPYFAILRLNGHILVRFSSLSHASHFFFNAFYLQIPHVEDDYLGSEVSPFPKDCLTNLDGLAPNNPSEACFYLEAYDIQTAAEDDRYLRGQSKTSQEMFEYASNSWRLSFNSSDVNVTLSSSEEIDNLRLFFQILEIDFINQPHEEVNLKYLKEVLVSLNTLYPSSFISSLCNAPALRKRYYSLLVSYKPIRNKALFLLFISVITGFLVRIFRPLFLDPKTLLIFFFFLIAFILWYLIRERKKFLYFSDFFLTLSCRVKEKFLIVFPRTLFIEMLKNTSKTQKCLWCTNFKAKL